MQRTIFLPLLLVVLMPACQSERPEEEREATSATVVTAPAQEPAEVVLDEVVVTGARPHGRELHAPAEAIAYMHAAGAVKERRIYPRYEPAIGETYHEWPTGGIKLAAEEPLSTFSIDVDSGAYSNMRRFLNAGQFPPADAIRVEELINYFAYTYPVPESPATPFSVTTEIAPAPWAEDRHLLLIGLKGYEVATEDLPPANLVFLIDVSGSMRAPNKLDLVRSSLKLLTRHLRAEDTIGIVTYAGDAGVLLEPVSGAESEKILRALEGLSAGGSTWGQGGIVEAYRLARSAFKEEGINRVILATDGDFNVGIADVEALKQHIERERESGIGLTTLGFGMGNYNDYMLEQLADSGNGNYGYIDSLSEANRILVRQASSTLQTIAGDVKIQIEFNPEVVSEYRLIGYENRMLRREDFNNDKVDAGEIGAGHSVTALYEIALRGGGGERIDPLRYGEARKSGAGKAGELGYLKLRYKRPGEAKSELITTVLHTSEVGSSIALASENLRFAAAVAGFGELLRGSEHIDAWSFDQAAELARVGTGADPYGYRREFLTLVDLAAALEPSLAIVTE